MPTFNWKELQESDMRLFDEKFEDSIECYERSYISAPVDEIKSHLLSTAKRSALAVIGEIMDRCEEESWNCGDRLSPENVVSLDTITKLLTELEAEVSK